MYNFSELKVGLIGCGTIGETLATLVDKGSAGNAKIIMVYSRDKRKAEQLSRKLNSKPKVAESIDDLIVSREINLVIEAASQDVISQYAVRVLESGKHLLIMSIGALLNNNLLNEIKSIANRRHTHVVIPSGAIAGLDGVKAASIGRIKEVVLTIRFTPRMIAGTLGAKNIKINLCSISKPVKVYEGLAKEACLLFPNHMNIALALSLAGIGSERTKTLIYADPLVRLTTTIIDVHSDLGELQVMITAKKKGLAARSAVAMIKRMTESFLVGT